MNWPDVSTVLDVASVAAAIGSVAVALALLRATKRFGEASIRQADAAVRQAEAADEQAVVMERQATATDRLATAMERQLERSSPRPYVFLRILQRGATIMLVNGGQRVAHNVRLIVEEEARPVAGQERWLTGSRLAAEDSPGIPPGGSVRESRSLDLLRLFERRDTVRFRIEYSDGEGREFYETCTYSLAEMNWLSGPPLRGPSQTEIDAGRRHSEIVGSIRSIAASLEESSRSTGSP